MRKVSIVGAFLCGVCFLAQGSERAAGVSEGERKVEGASERPSRLDGIDKEAGSVHPVRRRNWRAARNVNLEELAECWNFREPVSKNKVAVRPASDKQDANDSKRDCKCGDDFVTGSDAEKLWTRMRGMLSNTQSAVQNSVENGTNAILGKVDETSDLKKKILELEKGYVEEKKANDSLRQAAAGLYSLYRSRGVYLKGSEKFFQELGIADVKSEEFDYADCVESIVGRSARMLVEVKAARIRGSVDGRGLVKDLQDYKRCILRASDDARSHMSLINDIDAMAANYHVQVDEAGSIKKEEVRAEVKETSSEVPAKEENRVAEQKIQSVDETKAEDTE